MKLHRRMTQSCFFLGLLTAIHPLVLTAQSNTTSAIAGTVTDATGAALAGADVTAEDIGTGARRVGKTNQQGFFLFAQVDPGTYALTASAAGFAEQKSEPFAVEVGRTATLNLKLSPAAVSQTVEVHADTALISLDNPNTATTLEAQAIERLPNPGQDLTTLAQFAPGALMNTAGSSNDAKAAGGYGNVEFNGLPSTSI